MKMRICFLTHNVVNDNGAGVFSQRLIDGIRQTSLCDAVVVTSVSSKKYHALPLLEGGKIRILLNYFTIRKNLKKADLIHALDVYPYGIIAVLFSIGLGKKIVITAVGSGSLIPLHTIFLKSIIRYIYRRADAVTAISNFTRSEILHELPQLSVEVITPGVDMEDFQDDMSVGTRFSHILPNKYMLSVGSLRWRKGYKLSIRAFAEASKHMSDLHYVIVGKRYAEKEYRKLQQLISDLRLERKVHIFYDIDDRTTLIHIYKHAQLFVLMSRNVGYDVEGFGLVFLEAAAAGLPVIGSKNCGVADAMIDGENGFLIDERDINACARLIREIIGQEEARKRMSQQSVQFAKTQSWCSKIKRYVDIYNTLLA